MTCPECQRQNPSGYAGMWLRDEHTYTCKRGHVLPFETVEADALAPIQVRHEVITVMARINYAIVAGVAAATAAVVDVALRVIA